MEASTLPLMGLGSGLTPSQSQAQAAKKPIKRVKMIEEWADLGVVDVVGAHDVLRLRGIHVQRLQDGL